MVGLGPRRRPSRKGAYCYQNRAQHTDGKCLGSMADVPDDLLEQIRYLEKIFTVDKAKLKEVTTQFVKELVKGKSFVLSDQSLFLTALQVSVSKVAVLLVKTDILMPTYL